MAESNYEAALKDAGFELSNDMPTGEEQPTNDGFPEGADVIDLSGEQKTPAQEEVDDYVGDDIQPEDVLLNDYEEGERLDIDGLTLSTLSERLGTKFNSFDEVSNFLRGS